MALFSQEFHLFCEQEHPQRHANTDKNPYCVYGTLKLTIVTDLSFSERIAMANLSSYFASSARAAWWRGAARLYLSVSFLCPAKHQRDWPRFNKYFFGLATGTLECEKQQKQNCVSSTKNSYTAHMALDLDY